MEIKSLEELREIREKYKDRVGLRHGDSSSDKIEVLVGMATCGISSGARDTLNAFVEILEKEELDNVNVIPVGCLGYCHSEPTVQINIPGKDPVLYGNVKPDKVHAIVEKHIKEGKPLLNLTIDIQHERV